MPASLPTQVVIFGASGDLTARKLVPALFSAFLQGHLPATTQLVGVARRPWDDAGFRAHLAATVGAISADPRWNEFLAGVCYVRTNLDTAEDYRSLAGSLDALAGAAVNRVFYLAVKPDLFLSAVGNLHAVGLLSQSPDGGPRRRVVVEKPFGNDLGSAAVLNQSLLSLIGEDQLYRIDHYLGKETVQNLLVFRFRNALFEPLWNQKYVELVQITVGEAIGMENGRGGFYDGAGAARDIMQNHLLQVLALFAMEPPSSMLAKDIRDEKVKVLRSLRGFDGLDPRSHIIRGQYEGYRAEPGVAAQSETETWIAARTYLDNWRWGGVPFLLRTGKHLPARFTSVTVQFRMPPHTLFGSYDECHLRPNRITLRIQPRDGIDIDFEVKEPGQGLVIRPAKLDFDYAERFKKPAPDAYERLLIDVVNGDQSLFIRSDEIEQSWRWTDSLRARMAETPLHLYGRGTWGPPCANELFGECEGRWAQAPA
jgi:glucose-6-phosphate 1-dehydrogenase